MTNLQELDILHCLHVAYFSLSVSISLSNSFTYAHIQTVKKLIIRHDEYQYKQRAIAVDKLYSCICTNSFLDNI